MIRREDLKHLLHKGRGLKADVYLVGNLVVKDYRSRSFFLRQIGRILVSREEKVYKRLSSLKGTAKCYGRLDSYALILERIDGKRIYECDSLPTNFFTRLRKLVDAVHSRGVASRDLSPSNIIVAFSGEPYLIDFAVAFIAGPLTKPIFGIFKKLDIYGVARLKERWDQALEEDEKRMLAFLGWEACVRRWLKKLHRLCRSPEVSENER
ncbi:MAG: hypothetical protein ACP5R4_08415 [Armatimonadota bacterium]